MSFVYRKWRFGAMHASQHATVAEALRAARFDQKYGEAVPLSIEQDGAVLYTELDPEAAPSLLTAIFALDDPA